MPSPLVVVHGGQHGGWCWRGLLAPLRRAGIETYAPTLTGLGDRAHLLTREVDLDTHLRDVVSTIETEELTDVVLVGHSAATVIVSGVAAVLRPRIRHLVLLDGAVVTDGESAASSHPVGATFADRRREIGGVAVIPPGDGSTLGLAGDDLDWVRRRLTPHPLAALTQPVRLPPGWADGLPRTYIRCTRGAIASDTPYVRLVRDSPDWQYVEIEAGHDVMVSHPDVLADVLAPLCRDGAR